MQAARLFLVLTLAGMLLSLAGCMSVEREPAFAELELLDEGVSDNAVNVWPLFLQDGETSSYLWPLIKSSPSHFAIRPIYNYDKGTHDLLLGVVSADFRQEEYRLFPFLFHFPKRGFSMLFPLGYYSWATQREPRLIGFGSPLLFNWWYDNKAEQTYWLNILLAYNIPEGGDHHHAGLFPIYWHSSDKTRSSHLLLPLYYQLNDIRDDEFYSITPLTGYHSRDDFSEHWFVPFYYSSSSTNSSSLYTLLGTYSREGDDYMWHALLAGKSTSDYVTSRWVFPLFCYSQYHPQDYDPTEYTTLWTPVGGFGETQTWMGPFFPLIGTTRHEHGRSYWAMPLAYYSADTDPQTSIRTSSFDLLWLLYSLERERHPDMKDNNIDLWLGFGLCKWKSNNWWAKKDDSPNKSSEAAAPTFTIAPRDSHNFSLGFHILYDQESYSYTSEATAKNPASNHSRFESIALAYVLWNYRDYERYSTDVDNPTLERSSQHLSLLLTTYRHSESFTADTNVTHIEDYGLWGFLWGYESKTNGKYDSFSFSILQYLYKLRQEPDGTRQQLIFPFIETRSAPDESYSASFLWRLWRFERDADGQTRHWLFFIPLQ